MELMRQVIVVGFEVYDVKTEFLCIIVPKKFILHFKGDIIIIFLTEFNTI